MRQLSGDSFGRMPDIKSLTLFAPCLHLFASPVRRWLALMSVPRIFGINRSGDELFKSFLCCLIPRSQAVNEGQLIIIFFVRFSCLDSMHLCNFFILVFRTIFPSLFFPWSLFFVWPSLNLPNNGTPIHVEVSMSNTNSLCKHRRHRVNEGLKRFRGVLQSGGNSVKGWVFP